MAAIIGISTSGCQDGARPAYERCLDLQARGDAEGAAAACRAAVAMSADSHAGKLAAHKLTELASALAQLQAKREAVADRVPPTVTGEWCAVLRQRLQSRYFAEAARDYPDREPAFVRQVVTEGATNDWDNCIRDVGKPTCGYWECRWNNGMDGTHDCKKLTESNDEQ